MPERVVVRRRASLEGGSGPDDGAAQIGRSRQRGISAPAPARGPDDRRSRVVARPAGGRRSAGSDFGQLQKVDPGFSPDWLCDVDSFSPAGLRYKDPVAQRRSFAEAIDAVSAVPGVAAAGFVNVLPFSTYNRGTRYVADDANPPEPGREPAADYRIITDRYFAALGIPILEGRRSTHGIATRRTAWPSSTERLHAAPSLMPRPLDDVFALAVRHLDRRGAVDVVGVVGDGRHSDIVACRNRSSMCPLAGIHRDDDAGGQDHRRSGRRPPARSNGPSPQSIRCRSFFHHVKPMRRAC